MNRTSYYPRFLFFRNPIRFSKKVQLFGNAGLKFTRRSGIYRKGMFTSF